MEGATALATPRPDESLFRVRFDRLTRRERDYVRAMAELGPGPQRTGDIATLLGVKVQGLGPMRAGLIAKGMIYSLSHGDAACTVPMFDGFRFRTMPDWAPHKAGRHSDGCNDGRR